jgi:hypothetical protein
LWIVSEWRKQTHRANAYDRQQYIKNTWSGSLVVWYSKSEELKCIKYGDMVKQVKEAGSSSMKKDK